jgi:glycosyltransferase involved in cell wall biosynthesis
MKSICVLVQNFYEIDIRVRRKAEALVAAGYSVDVLALKSKFSRGESYELNGVTVHTFELGKQRGSGLRYVYEYATFLLWCALKIGKLMKQKRFAVIDINTLPDFLVFAGFLAKWRGAKLLLDMHEITPEFMMSKYGYPRGKWQVRLATWLELISMKYADHLLTINQPIDELLAGRGLKDGKSTIIMNAADEEIFAKALVPGAQPPREMPAKPPFLMMYHGTLTKIYGLDIAIEAYAKARAQIPGAEFWILGGGTEQAALEARAKELGVADGVRFVGSVMPDEIPFWVKMSDVGVLATRQDVFLDFSFSNKLSEYIIMDKAVIVSRLRTIAHYFSDDAVLFFEPNDPTSLAAQMVRMYHDSSLRQRLAQRAKLEFEPIRWQVMKERYLALIERLSADREA